MLGGAWARSLDAIKVTGSNGKGSVVSMTAAILEACGVVTGRYLSPHVYRFEERIAVSDETIGRPALDAALDRTAARWDVYAKAHPRELLGRFEHLSAAALDWFAGRRPEALVLEAGIGGRHDPITLAPGDLAALVSVDLEHAPLLGSTIEEIARDKADLARPGGTLVVGRVGHRLLQVIREHCDGRGVAVVSLAAESRARRARPRVGGFVVDLEVGSDRFEDLVIAAHGRHQIDNAALALHLAGAWLQRHRPAMPRSVWHAGVRAGLAGVALPGRYERIRRRPDVFVDTAHTPSATAALARTVRRHGRRRRILLVTGASEGRSVAPLLAPLVSLASRILVSRSAERGRPAAEVRAALSPGSVPCTVVEPLPEAVAWALETARRDRSTVLIAGGLFLAREAARAITAHDREA